MRRICIALTSSLGLALVMLGCSSRTGQYDFVAKEEPWRASEEIACLHSGMVRESGFVQGRSALGGPSVCGALKPFEVAAVDSGTVALRPAALLRCPMIPAVERWMHQHVLPAAQAHFGQPVVEIKVAASYSCRPINHISGGRLSEHGHANALDVSGFRLADGRLITVKGGWSGDPTERSFLRSVHRGGCEIFSTVLGPMADSSHHDHFHLDLARHGRSGTLRVCR
jgi:hypothetical protein